MKGTYPGTSRKPHTATWNLPETSSCKNNLLAASTFACTSKSIASCRYQYVLSYR